MSYHFALNNSWELVDLKVLLVLCHVLSLKNLIEVSIAHHFTLFHLKGLSPLHLLGWVA
jgi:hypothetical protein